MINPETKLLMLGSYENYLARSVRNAFIDHGIGAKFIKATVDNLETLTESTIQAFIVFADEVLSQDMKFLVYLKDMAIEQELKVFIIGYPDEVDAIAAVIPEHLTEKKFIRPINANKVVDEISAFINDNSVDNKKKILVVDDSITDLRSIRTILSDKYQVIIAGSGASAIMYLSQEHPDLVLLDYEMPIVNGKQVLEMIRGEVAYSSTPVIFLTAKGDKKSVLDVVNLHPDGYLLKSMDMKMIKSSIDEFFEKQKSLVK